MKILFILVSYPLVGLSGTFNGQATCHSANYDLQGGYDKYQVSSSLKAITGVSKPGDYDVNFKVFNIFIPI